MKKNGALESISAKETKHISASALAGLPAGYTRATFIVKQKHIDRLKALSFVNKISIKELLDQALTKFLKDKDVTAILMEAINRSQDS